MTNPDLQEKVKSFIQNDLGFTWEDTLSVDLRPGYVVVSYFPDGDRNTTITKTIRFATVLDFS